MNRASPPVGLALLLAACTAEPATNTAADDEAPARHEASAGATAGPAQPNAEPQHPAGDEASIDPEGVAGAPIRLQPLTAEDRQVELEGELGCSFTAAGAGQPLLVAFGVVSLQSSINGIIKSGDEVVRVFAAGDFGDLERGPTLASKGMSVTIVRGDRIATGNEQTEYEAVLRADRMDGSVKTYSGRWICGP